MQRPDSRPDVEAPPAACNTIALSAVVPALRAETGVLPAGEGGVIANGRYVQIESVPYQGHSGTGTGHPAAFEYVNGDVTLVGEAFDENYRSNERWEASGNRLTMKVTCPFDDAPALTVRFSSVTPDGALPRVSILLEESGVALEKVYERVAP